MSKERTEVYCDECRCTHQQYEHVRRCASCRYFDDHRDGWSGKCRRMAPGGVGWPTVKHEDWCGQHAFHVWKLPENER